MGKYVFGVDIGGTTAKIGLLTEEGEKVELWEIPTTGSLTLSPSESEESSGAAWFFSTENLPDHRGSRS